MPELSMRGSGSFEELPEGKAYADKWCGKNWIVDVQPDGTLNTDSIVVVLLQDIRNEIRAVKRSLGDDWTSWDRSVTQLLVRILKNTGRSDEQKRDAAHRAKLRQEKKKTQKKH